MRVLLVEDDAMIAEAVSANLKDGGYAVDWVKNGAQVAAAAAAQLYDLMPLTGQPEVFLGNSPTLFDEKGKLIDSARDFVQSYINQFVSLVEKHAK